MAASPSISPELLRASSRNVLEATERILRAGQQPGKSAFVARAMHALATLADELDERALADAAGARSDMGVFISALNQPEAASALSEPDPLQAARLRGIQAKQQILEAEGGTLTAIEVAQLLGITRQAVDKRRRAGTLIGLQAGKRGYLYPRWQFDEHGRTIDGMSLVLEDLAEFSQWMQAGFLLSPNLRLDTARPLDLIRQGSVEQVRRAAQAYGEHGAA